MAGDTTKDGTKEGKVKDSSGMSWGQGILTALGAGVSGIGQGRNAGRAGSQFTDDILRSNEAKRVAKENDARLIKSDARQARSDAMGEERHATNQAKSKFAMEVAKQQQMNSMYTGSVKNYTNRLTSASSHTANARASASGGQASYINQEQRDTRAKWARVGEGLTQLDILEQAYKTSKGTDPIMANYAKETMYKFAKEHGWEIQEGQTEDGSPIIKPPNMPYMTGSPESVANLRKQLMEADASTYNEMVMARQSADTAIGGSKSYMYGQLGENPVYSAKDVLNGGARFAKTVSENPYWNELSGFVNTANEFIKDDGSPNEYIGAKMINMLKDRGIRVNYDENGKPLVNLNDINESFNRYLPEGKKVDLFDTGGEMVYESITKTHLQQMRERSGMQNEANKIKNEYEKLYGVDQASKEQALRSGLEMKAKLAEEFSTKATTKATEKTVKRIQNGQVKVTDSVGEISDATGIDIGVVADSRLRGGGDYLEKVTGKKDLEFDYINKYGNADFDLFSDMAQGKDSPEYQRASQFIKDNSKKDERFNKKDFESYQNRAVRDLVRDSKKQAKEAEKEVKKEIEKEAKKGGGGGANKKVANDFFDEFDLKKLDKKRADSKKESGSKTDFPLSNPLSATQGRFERLNDKKKSKKNSPKTDFPIRNPFNLGN